MGKSADYPISAQLVRELIPASLDLEAQVVRLSEAEKKREIEAVGRKDTEVSGLDPKEQVVKLPEAEKKGEIEKVEGVRKDTAVSRSDLEAQVDELPEAVKKREIEAVERVRKDTADRKCKRLIGSAREGFREKVRRKVTAWKDEREKVREAREARRSCVADFEAHKKLVLEELPAAKLPQCYEEIRRLLQIDRSPIYAKALEEWSRKESLFTNRVERKKKKVANLKNEIYQLIGFFSVFQGVLLTAVSQSNLLHRNNWWSPIILSVVASAVTIGGVVQKLVEIGELQDTIFSDEDSLKEAIDRSNKLRSTGVKGFEFGQYYEGKEKRKQPKFRFWLYFSLVIGSLVLFAVVFPVSHWQILYRPGPDPYPSTN